MQIAPAALLYPDDTTLSAFGAILRRGRSRLVWIRGLSDTNKKSSRAMVAAGICFFCAAKFFEATNLFNVALVQ
jgi:hypothetical protein